MNVTNVQEAAVDAIVAAVTLAVRKELRASHATRVREWHRRRTGWDPAPRSCLVCGEKFVPKFRRHVLCGDACYGEWRRRKAQRDRGSLVVEKAIWVRTERECVSCGFAFMPRSRRVLTCSDACRLRYQVRKFREWRTANREAFNERRRAKRYRRLSEHQTV